MLDDMDMVLLDFERGWANATGPKDRMIELCLGLSSEAYYARLRELIFDAPARAHDPLTLRRLERMLDDGSCLEGAG
ncbi:MAG: DUF3263 domain-containing protein [Actinobacteria bacterium]|nr:MAG: DUF3263 domain-containing protein [Actinomycetota bacterium]REK38378.1 MAG: DUF3263 domain-containing protein [Actinomycetota bacterium]